MPYLPGQERSVSLCCRAGYVAGITHKILHSQDIVLLLYILNLLMVCVDIGLFYRNQQLDRQTGSADAAR